MRYTVAHLKDVIGGNYLGLEIPAGTVSRFLAEMRGLLGDAEFERYSSRQAARDAGEYHMTILSAEECGRLAKSMGPSEFVRALEPILELGIEDLCMLGLGRARKAGEEAYFVVCRSQMADAIRERFGLAQRDFHVTIGFRHRDVFGVPKNEVLKKQSDFLKLLGQEFYKMGNWDFVKDLPGFDFDVSYEVYPVSLSETVAEFACGSDCLGVAYLGEPGEFRVVYGYRPEKQAVRLPETEALRIIKTNS